MSRRSRRSSVSGSQRSTATENKTPSAPSAPDYSAALAELSAAIRELSTAVRENPAPAAPAAPATPAKKAAAKKAPAKKAAAKKAPAKKAAASDDEQLRSLESKAFACMEQEIEDQGTVLVDLNDDEYDAKIQTIVNEILGEEVPVAELDTQDFETIINAYAEEEAE